MTRFLMALALIGMISPIHAQQIFNSADEIRPPLPGTQAPDVTLTKTDGTTVSLRATAAAQPTVLIFYRGGW